MRNTIIYIALCILSINATAQQNDCLFKNPLCFYNSDILTYLQVLHKQQMYKEMLPFMYGPALDNLNNEQRIEKIENASFGYQMKRAGIKTINDKEWSLTYTRTLLGTQETFKINCDLANDKCRVYFDNKKWNEVFKK